ncbi:hypothetical protein HNE04_27415 [Caenimonas sp. S4]|nr:hypothetical protein [Caenimonas soli]
MLWLHEGAFTPARGLNRRPGARARAGWCGHRGPRVPTGSWNGGRPRREWERSGSPPHPGRLNEVMHVVFKAAESSWRRFRKAIAALLRNEVYRQGIDGEAVAWACTRQQCDARRRILVVVSDGSPMDGATSLANDDHYLDHHLQAIVAAQSAAGDIDPRAGSWARSQPVLQPQRYPRPVPKPRVENAHRGVRPHGQSAAERRALIP